MNTTTTSRKINMIRLKTRITEWFKDIIDMSDCSVESTFHFESRSLAALALLINTNLELDQACKYITDGYHDMGLDAIYLDESQKTLFLVQSKWRESGTGSITKKEIDNFADGIKHVLNDDLAGCNDKIKSRSMDIETAISQIGYQIHSIFIHTGDQEADHFALYSMDTLLKEVNDDDQILIYDEYGFKDIYNYVSSGREKQVINIEDVILSNWGRVDNPYRAYYGVVSAATIGDWYNEYGNRLFAKNIRFYKGNTEVNSSIKNTLRNDPENFIYFNNGIKLLCNSVVRKLKNSTTNESGLFSLFGVTLVNGAQTTGAIGETYLKYPEYVVRAKIMIQIIELPDVDTPIYSQITKWSNTQNRIDNKDFVSLDPIQDKLRSDLNFAHIDYLYKSGSIITNYEKQISFDEAIVALACLQKDISFATTAKRNVGALSEDILKPPYKILFNDNTNSFNLLNSVLFLRNVDQYLQRKKENSNNNRERLVCIHANRFILHVVLQKCKIDPRFQTTVLERDFVTNRTAELIDQLLPSIILTMEELYPDSYPASVFKNSSKCKEIQSKLDS